MSTDVEWFSAGIDRRHERLVRVWQPGDGLRCSYANAQGRTACAAPVAVLKTKLVEDSTWKYDKSVVNRVLCIRHLAKQFDQAVAAPADNRVELRAMEELAQRYWDQYSEIRDRIAQELLDERFSALPNGLREQVIEAAASDLTGEAVA